MGCLVQFFILPIQMMIYIVGFMFQFLVLMVKFFVIAIKGIGEMVVGFFGLFVNKANNSTEYRDMSNYNEYNAFRNISNKSNSIDSKDNVINSNLKSNFDKESELWGLSEEDKRIAKEEQMSPSDYIEAEERDNDELIDDD